MIQVCPNCGNSLQCVLNDGITHCDHCNQVFDACEFNQLLAAAWQVRRDRLSLHQMKMLKLDPDLCILVFAFVQDYGFNHEEFRTLLKKLGISQKCVLPNIEQN